MGSKGLEVRGGAAGVAVTTEAMHTGAGRVRRTGAEIGAFTHQLSQLVTNPALAITAGLDPGGAAAVADSAAGATVGSDGLIRTSAGLIGFSVLTDSAALAYEVAETGAERAIEAGKQVLGVSAPYLQPVAATAGTTLVLGGVGWVGARAVMSLPAGFDSSTTTVPLFADPYVQRATGNFQISYPSFGFSKDRWLDATTEQLGADGQSALTWLANHPDVTQHGISLMPILLRSIGLVPETDGTPGASVPELALAAVTLAPAAGLFRQGEVTTRIRAQGKHVQAPTTVAGVLHEASALGANKEASAVKFIRQGNRWIVIPPATQDWSPVSGSNPANLGSNAAMIGGQAGGGRADSTEALAKAMREAGIGPDDPVMIVGHSQAGITAVDLASDSELKDEFNVQVILTAASPTGAHDVPADVQVMHIENGDLVPQLDGVPNPDKANVTTVSAMARELPGAPQGERAPGAFHGLEEYGLIAGEIDRSDHASIQGWKDAAAPFLSGGDAEEMLVEVTRELPG